MCLVSPSVPYKYKREIHEQCVYMFHVGGDSLENIYCENRKHPLRLFIVTEAKGSVNYVVVC